MNSISLPCFLRYQDPHSLTADAVNNKTGLFAKSSEDADYLLFLEDCFSPGVAIFLRRSSGGPQKVRVNTGGCYHLISAVGAPPDEISMAYLREHKEVLNEIIEKYGGDRITDDEEGARLVAVLPNFGTGQWADKEGLILALTPDTCYGASSLARLRRFYRRFGFRKNAGRNINFLVNESMLRLPKRTDE